MQNASLDTIFRKFHEIPLQNVLFSGHFPQNTTDLGQKWAKTSKYTLHNHARYRVRVTASLQNIAQVLVCGNTQKISLT